MMFPPMPRDVDATAKPNVFVREGIVDKVPEGRKTAGPTDNSAMQTDGHDAGYFPTFFIQRVEAVF